MLEQRIEGPMEVLMEKKCGKKFDPPARGEKNRNISIYDQITMWLPNSAEK